MVEHAVGLRELYGERMARYRVVIDSLSCRCRVVIVSLSCFYRSCLLFGHCVLVSLRLLVTAC